MNKKIISSKILIILILNYFNIQSFEKNNNSNEQELINDYDYTEITQLLSDKEVNLIYNNPEKLYVYLTPEIITCLNNIDLTELNNKPKTNNTLQLMKKHIQKYKSASYEFTLEVIDQAINYYKLKENNHYLDLLEQYKIKLETGELVIIIEKDIIKRNKKQTYNCLVVRKSLRTRSLFVRQNASICGNLCVKKNLGVNGNATISGTLTTPNINANSIMLNGNPVIVNALPSNLKKQKTNLNNPCNNRMGILNGGVQITFDNDFTIDNTQDLSAIFNANPIAPCITVNNSNIGILTGNDLTENDPLLQALDSFSIICANTGTNIGINPVYLFGLNLSFNVSVKCTLFDPMETPRITLGLENLPASINTLLYQIDPLPRSALFDQALDSNLTGEACYSCSNIYICKSPEIKEFEDETNMPTRTYSNKLAAIRSVTPNVSNIMVSTNGTLTFTVNLSVLAYDTENNTSATLPNLANLIKQFFQSSIVTFTVNGVVQDAATGPNCPTGFTPGKTC